MKKFFLLTFVISALTLFYSCSKKEIKNPSQDSLERLLKGNERYVNNKSIHPNRSEERRQEISSKQSPYAIIVGCSDSRVSPEIIFDEGLGDLFVVRVAGNVIGEIELDSIEYSALYLNSSIILVLGHENCGAINAVINNNTQDIEAVANIIKPSVEKAKQEKEDNLLEVATKINALNMKNYLENSPNIKKLINDKKISVYAGYYNLKTGAVEILK